MAVKTSSTTDKNETDAVLAKLYQFCHNNQLLDLALTHRSFISESPLSSANIDTDIIYCNERLEFLGDSILSLVISEHLYKAYPDYPEGDLTRIRSQIVRTSALAKVAKTFGIGSLIKMGKGEQASGGKDKESILADTLEAIIGAIYLDSGLEEVRKFILSILKRKIATEANKSYLGDPKNRLQELTVKIGLGNPSYDVVASGPEHKRIWKAAVFLEGKKIATGQGVSIRTAQSVAAERAWGKLITKTENSL